MDDPLDGGPAPARFGLERMRPRDPNEVGRTASMLELFFDLVFTIGVSVTAEQLRQSLSDGRIAHGLAVYAVVFFAVWWAWMNFTWFASAFDVDDWLYRLVTVLQMAGVMVMSAGVAPMFTDDDLTWIVVGYVIMRVAMVT